MKIRNLVIERMPGFKRDGPKIKGLSEGLNVICGPNGSGKTTVCRAVRGLLWPETLKDFLPAEIRSDWTGGYYLETRGTKRTCQRDGAPAALPDLPSSHVADCYTITMESLFDGSKTDAELTDRVIRQMAGGYDLGAVRNSPFFSLGARHGNNEKKDLKDARNELQQRQKLQQALLLEEEDLGALREEKEEAAAAGERAGLLENAAQLVETRGSLEKARKTAEKRLKAAEDDLSECNLPDPGPTSLALSENDERLDLVREFEHKLADLRKDGAADENRLEDAASRLEEIGSPEALEGLSPEGLDRIDELFRRDMEAQQKREGIQGRLDALGDKSETRGLEELSEGLGLLREWLRLPRLPETFSGRGRALAWAGVLLTAALSVVLALVLSPLTLLLLIPALLGGAALFRRAPSHGDRAVFQKRFERTGLSKVERWTAEGVQSALSELEKEMADARLEEAKGEQRRKHSAEVAKADLLLEEFNDQWSALRAELGVGFERTSLSLVDFAERFSAFQKALEARNGRRDQIAALEETYREELGKIASFLAGFGYEPPKDASEAAARLKDLKERAGCASQAEKDIARAREDIDGAAESIRELNERQAGLFEKAGLSDGAGGVAGFAGLTAEKINGLAAAEKEKAERFGPIIERITEIEGNIKRATEGNEVEDALFEYEKAAEALRQKRDEELFAAAGRLLLDELEEEYERESRPEVLKRAGDLFSAITLGKYTLGALGVGPDSGDHNKGWAFRAVDNETKEGLGLHQLSRGTVMQLLLAVRVAFASHEEKGEKLPLLLDEVLSTSDPHRFRAIATSLINIVRDEDRQVLYFTCQPGDAKAWKQIAEEMGRDDIGYFFLGAAGKKASILDTSAAIPKAVDPPGDRNMREYRESLGAPDFDPARPIGELHPVHFLDTPKQVYDLLSRGIRSLGQAQALFDKGELGPDFSPKAALYKAVSEAWRVGRGRPVSREVLRDAGVTETFIDRITLLAEDLKFDAKALVQALEARKDERVSGFRRHVIEEIREYLEGEGFLDPSEPLTGDEARKKVLVEVDDLIRRGVLSAKDFKTLLSRFWPGGIS